MNISLPKPLKDYIEQRVSDSDFSTPSEYVRALVREDRKRQAHERLESMLAEGLASGEAVEANQAYWAAKRRALGVRQTRRRGR